METYLYLSLQMQCNLVQGLTLIKRCASDGSAQREVALRNVPVSSTNQYVEI